MSEVDPYTPNRPLTSLVSCENLVNISTRWVVACLDAHNFGILTGPTGTPHGGGGN